MVFWIISFFTGLVAIMSLYYVMDFKDLRLKVPAMIAFSLLLMGETMDLLADIAFDTILILFAEMLEMFITVGFFSLIYYTHLKKVEKKNKRRSKK
ncbi:MAG: hypothetical protein JW791_00630 [Nanoarchaeota archaeon]|nr:hypothetical protein [Nanoarchaeota archaeon]